MIPTLTKCRAVVAEEVLIAAPIRVIDLRERLAGRGFAGERMVRRTLAALTEAGWVESRAEGVPEPIRLTATGEAVGVALGLRGGGEG